MHDKTLMHDLRMKFCKYRTINHVRKAEKKAGIACHILGAATHFGCGLAYAIIDVEQ